MFITGALLIIAGGLMAAGRQPVSFIAGRLEDDPLPASNNGQATGQVARYVTATRCPTPSPRPTLSPAPIQVAVLSPASPTATNDTTAARPPAVTVPPATLTSTPTTQFFPTYTPSTFGPPIRIVAPAINLDAEVVPVSWKQVTQDGSVDTVWEVPDYAAGWHRNSALPGRPGNTVISGHHNVGGRVFRYLVNLQPGDAVTLFTGQRPYSYTVESRFILPDEGVSEERRRENARWIGTFPDQRLTLVTCWPYDSNTHRVIVIARPAP